MPKTSLPKTRPPLTHSIRHVRARAIRANAQRCLRSRTRPPYFGHPKWPLTPTDRRPDPDGGLARNSTPDPDGTTQSSIFPIARDYPAKRFLTSCCRMAVVIFKDKITATICGDLGPPNKIGEASIQ